MMMMGMVPGMTDMSELEDEGLKDSLLRQKVAEDELNLEIEKVI